MGSPIVFFILATICIGASLGMLFSKNAIYSALFLVLNFCAVAVFYIVLSAPFIAMVQITVYAGAIMVLFLFVIMLLGAERLNGAAGGEGGGWQRPFAWILAGGLAVSLFVALSQRNATASNPSSLAPLPDNFSSPEAIGELLFQSYVFPFEVTSILLLVAMMSLVVWKTQKRKKTVTERKSA